ncbi:uncharacterized protein TNCT_22701 [Trichonephila clavata]|uniref:Uncharacterized protein n=1 Tax=Trichonephila clavata TaxID=2740835 RepID=A0A8X6IXX6_TRICU|nr:uncharacterized protein TNCT_22701 [Trichonephila clavata]
MEVGDLAKDVFLYVWFRNKIVEELPTLSVDPILEAFVEKLRDVVLVETYVTMKQWMKFLRKHSERMISSPTLYAKYVIFACYLVNKQYENGFECFLRVVTLVAEFALYSKTKGHPEFTQVSSDIFDAFYAKEIKEKFKSQGNWKKFKQHVGRRESLNQAEDVNKAIDDGMLPSDILSNVIGMSPTKSPVIGGCSINDIKRETVESHQQTLELVETIASVLENFQNPTTEEKAVEIEQESLISSGDSQDQESAAGDSQDQESAAGKESGEGETDLLRNSSNMIKQARRKLMEALADVPALTSLIRYVLMQQPEAKGKSHQPEA